MRLFGSRAHRAASWTGMGAQEGEVLTHPLITRSIEQAQKRVELQNFQARKRLLEYDDVMNQQREVIYSLRVVRARGRRGAQGRSAQDGREGASTARVETVLAEYETATEWDFDLLRQELLMHYLLQVPELEDDGAASDRRWPRSQERRSRRRRERVRREARDARRGARREGQGYGDRLLSLVMLNVLDEKWKDHLYDLDQLRNAIHYRSWGQKDPLVEYKQEAYTMFVDLMNDIYNTFTDRFLKVQLVFEQPPADRRAAATGADERRRCRAAPTQAVQRARHSRGRRAGGEAGRRRRRRGDGRRPDGAARTPSRPRRATGPGDRRGGPRAKSLSEATAGAAGDDRLVDRRTQRSVSVRVGEEVQEVPRRDAVSRDRRGAGPTRGPALVVRVAARPDAGNRCQSP